ncbi:MAG: hypothetical protein A2Y63_01135 [Candidatus Riflebacteria bacterium RBG_13_59_9]|nr:MAG: hypothetical protein A2Y63_01135 [Candidatus Riflebacteria bacterium RBG_13_59_9]
MIQTATWKKDAGSGFTLVELLVVMSIIMILVGIAVPAVMGARTKARDAEVRAGVHEIHKALSTWSVDRNGFFPGMNWVFDSDDILVNGPGLRGATPVGALSEQRFTVPKAPSAERYLADGVTPDPYRIDVLVRDGYLLDYPANPFLRVAGKAERQMTNLFYFAVEEANGPDLSDPANFQWCYPAWEESSTMRIEYKKYAHGHFTYIPLNPVNTQGYDFVGDWDNLNDQQRSEYYKYVRSFILIGWGASRSNDDQAVGLSNKWWDSDESAFDLDGSLTIDPIESTIIDLIDPHMYDSGDNNAGFGQIDITGHPNIDKGFYGAAVIVSSNN